jgi:hypothetical protein
MVEEEDERCLRRDIRVFIPQGECYRCEQEQHVLELYSPQAVELR